MTGAPRLAASVAACLVSAACAPAPLVLSRAPEPSASVTRLEVKALERQRAALELAIEVDNPGAEMALVGVDYEVLVEDRSFALGTAALHSALAAGQTSLGLPIELAYLDLPMRARTRAKNGEPVRVVVRGKLQALRDGQPAAVPFDGEAEAVVDEEPAREEQ